MQYATSFNALHLILAQMGASPRWATSARTTASTLWCARCCACAVVLLARGCSITTTGCSGNPRAAARMRAAWVKASVMTVTAARPRFSASIPSWRPHAVQDPQSATAWMIASHSLASWSKTSSGVGILWLILRCVTTRDTP